MIRAHSSTEENAGTVYKYCTYGIVSFKQLKDGEQFRLEAIQFAYWKVVEVGRKKWTKEQKDRSINRRPEPLGGGKIMSFAEDYGLDTDTGEWLSIDALQPTEQRNPNKQTPRHFVNTSAQVGGWFLIIFGFWYPCS